MEQFNENDFQDNDILEKVEEEENVEDEEVDIFEKHGYASRDEYLAEFVETLGVDYNIVYMVADTLGDEKAFTEFPKKVREIKKQVMKILARFVLGQDE